MAAKIAGHAANGERGEGGAVGQVARAGHAYPGAAASVLAPPLQALSCLVCSANGWGEVDVGVFGGICAFGAGIFFEVRFEPADQIGIGDGVDFAVIRGGAVGEAVEI